MADQADADQLQAGHIATAEAVRVSEEDQADGMAGPFSYPRSVAVDDDGRGIVYFSGEPRHRNNCVFVHFTSPSGFVHAAVAYRRHDIAIFIFANGMMAVDAVIAVWPMLDLHTWQALSDSGVIVSPTRVPHRLALVSANQVSSLDLGDFHPYGHVSIAGSSGGPHVVALFAHTDAGALERQLKILHLDHSLAVTADVGSECGKNVAFHTGSADFSAITSDLKWYICTGITAADVDSGGSTLACFSTQTARVYWFCRSSEDSVFSAVQPTTKGRVAVMLECDLVIYRISDGAALVHVPGFARSYLERFALSPNNDWIVSFVPYSRDDTYRPPRIIGSHEARLLTLILSSKRRRIRLLPELWLMVHRGDY